jgi:small subunit ribosomal protein S15e
MCWLHCLLQPLDVDVVLPSPTLFSLLQIFISASPFSFRGIELEALLDKSQKELLQLLTCRIRRRFARGIPRAYNTLLKKLRKAKKATAAFDKPATVKTHLRNMPIIPEMIGSVVGVYNGQFFVNVEIKVYPNS